MNVMTKEGWSVHPVFSDGYYVPKLRNQGYDSITVAISRSINPIKHIVNIAKLFK
jgi:hypothetical protein